MPRNEFFQLMLAEFKELKGEIKEIRQTDIPEIKLQVSGFHTKLKTLERQQTWSTRLYTILGGAIAVIITKFTGHN